MALENERYGVGAVQEPFETPGRAVDNHPVIKARYRTTSRLAEKPRDHPVYEACEGASEHLRSEHHRPPLMPEIRLADRAG